MASPDFIDPYPLPGTNVLRNLVGVTSSAELAIAEAELAIAEADLSFARALQLLDSPVPETNDLRELQQIHLHLFQDVYEWAGQIRTVDVRKDIQTQNSSCRSLT